MAIRLGLAGRTMGQGLLACRCCDPEGWHSIQASSNFWFGEALADRVSAERFVRKRSIPFISAYKCLVNRDFIDIAHFRRVQYRSLAFP